MSKTNFLDYHENLMQRLKNQELAIAYLNEALADEDQHIFLLALKDVIEAKEGLKERAKMDRPTIHRMLSEKGGPRWASLTSLVKALGLQLHIFTRNK